jgi:soluble lytic murein transglycosylase
MKRLALVCLILLLVVSCLVGLYHFNRYWQHRFDPLIARHANFYNLDADLVWSVIYEETYFRPWTTGDAGEIGLMQVTPTVAREWAAETGLPDLALQVERDTRSVLRDPEKNIQIGCWYLEKVAKRYSDEPAAMAKMLAAYNAGASRVTEWSRLAPGERQPSETAFIERITFPTTREYVTSIISRYRLVKDERAAKLAGNETAGMNVGKASQVAR